MFIFHDAPPPSRPWSAIIREPCASAPVSASSRSRGSRPSGLGQDRAAQRRERAQVAGREQLAEVVRGRRARACASASRRTPRGRGAPPSPAASASAASRTSARSGSSRRVPPHAGQRTCTATISAPRRAVAAERRLAPRSAGTASGATRPPRRAPSPARASRRPRARPDRRARRSSAPGRSRTGSRRRRPRGRPIAAASIGATPDPQNGSSTRSPGAVAAAIRSATRSGGLRDQYLWSR